eukprot:TRINITY_DN9555_c0_g1_i1.p1 TRINITY_DN9555_c0_g1~~TRINITY_DN9555_c0_g1_i1.p1  ORF type:complete len:346 (+),score=65.72 TRINITY_DN9555_c0_g1_i1:949-1986(+)
MVVYLGADVGGSLLKVVLYGGDHRVLSRRMWKFLTRTGGRRVMMTTVKTTKENMDYLVRTIEQAARGEEVKIAVTGGGIHKHKHIIERLKVTPNVTLCTKNDEFRTLALGLDFIRRQCPSHSLYQLSDFLFHGDTGPDRAKVTTRPLKLDPTTPLLVVNIGTGTSFVDVNGDSDHIRVGGSSLGGGTFLGLCKGLTNCKSFEDALRLAAEGDSRNADMVVGDIYGEDDIIGIHGLRRSTLASSFAKLAGTNTASPADRCLATLVMVSMNLAALAHLHARLYHRNLILFTGTFLHKNPMALRTLAYAIHFWSQGARQAVFVQHSSYLGALGSLSIHLPHVADEAKL